MELNRRTKVVGGVLALAVAALVYDRFIAGGPAEAGAAPPGVPAAPPSAERSEPKPEAPKQPRGALATKLASLEVTEVGPSTREDVLVAPVGWFPVEEEAAAAPAAPKAAETSKHVLNSVLASRGKPIESVVIDGQLLRLGVAKTVTLENEARSRTYEFVRARVDDDRVTHVEFKVDGRLLEVKRKFAD